MTASLVMDWGDEPDQTDMTECPACSYEDLKENLALGRLGNLMHYRCRLCGWQWAESINEESENASL